MATWKDDEIAKEALRGNIKVKRGGTMKKYLGFAAAAAIVALAVVTIRYLRPGALSVSSREAPAAKEAEAPKKPPVAEAPVAPKSSKPIIDDTPVIIMPPVTIEPRKPVAAPVVTERPEFGKFAETRSALRGANSAAALDALKALNAHPLDEAEKLEAAVLEGRAHLLAGNLDEARKKFELIGTAAPEKETGADAMLGNFWCQAGSLGRVRSSELQTVIGGAPSWGNAMAALEEGRRMEEKASGDLAALEQARALYQQAFDTNQLEDKYEKDCLARLQDLTQRLILDPKVACTRPQAAFHKVESGEFVERIAKKYKVNQGQLKIINRLNEKLAVRQGQILKMLPGDVVYKVDRSRLTGVLYIDGVFIKYYRVGIGPGNATPRGAYTIDKKLVNPDWYYDGKRVPFGDKENILGTRWMGFNTTENGGQGAGLGVHGTAYPESVPGRESKGCVRMLNKDVEELYDLMPQGGKVQIVE